jgi:hypothetical protein
VPLVNNALSAPTQVEGMVDELGYWDQAAAVTWRWARMLVESRIIGADPELSGTPRVAIICNGL